ncbi:radical SAM superfamily enzyme YgiQ (UPF0313 family) [Anaerobacterium chartisolvens]|uniref:Radical SAM superfamily enzyme YgiQ (UPF0313 family) n=1 Tax=Anaerobacterium chartisolvens TaxID=1297424 RepID=A0A369BIL3_9FIRM|nr:radical SAM protein [Anaerobacterium chartisolvens]RCX21015.1 radical SAM superfamily enzyme YgiQ (UPF0313 family) [Anaerobacterium chartisolvens]
MKVYDYDVLFINPPLEIVSDKTAQFGVLTDFSYLPVKFFNPGILSMGTFLDWKGYTVKVCDISRTKQLEKELKDSLNWGCPRVVAISGIYGLSYRAVIYIASLVKMKYPNVYVIVGGHHMGLLGGTVLKESKYIDIVIRYEGEYPLMEIFEYIDGKRAITDIDGIVFRYSLLEKENEKMAGKNIIPFTAKHFVSSANCIDITYEDILVNTNRSKPADINEMPFMKFDLYPNYMEYSPYVEESRGCYGECEYCTNCSINGRKYRKKESKRFLEELKYVTDIYGKDRHYPFLAAIFGVDIKNTIEICEGIKRDYGEINWVSETRVDVHWEEYIDLMYESGCRQYEVGLESASKETLRQMNKTKNPDYYLQKAESLIFNIKRFKDAQISLNFMFYAGETPETLKDDLRFLTRHMEDIGAVDFFPLIAFPGTRLWDRFNEFNEKYGSTIIKNDTWDSFHFYPINPSKYFSYEEAGHFAHVIEKMFAK